MIYLFDKTVEGIKISVNDASGM